MSKSSSKLSHNSNNKSKSAVSYMEDQGQGPDCHIRRCHVCGTVNESESSVIHKCGGCGKHLAPFYYFDESQIVGFGDVSVSQSQESAPAEDSPYYKPIWGLSVVW